MRSTDSNDLRLKDKMFVEVTLGPGRAALAQSCVVMSIVIGKAKNKIMEAR